MAQLTQSRKIAVGKNAALTSEAMDAAETFVNSLDLAPKTALRMRLLTEEILEMLKSMVGQFSGLFWLEADGKECRICIDGTAEVDVDAERDLLSVATDGKNASVKGFTAKLSQFLRHYKAYISLLAERMNSGAGAFAEDFLFMGATQPDFGASEISWSMSGYKTFLLDDTHAKTAQIEEARDELEKSIVASLADDVKVGVKDDRIQITVIKKL